jgi:hypothetical protein
LFFIEPCGAARGAIGAMVVRESVLGERGVDERLGFVDERPAVLAQ